MERVLDIAAKPIANARERGHDGITGNHAVDRTRQFQASNLLDGEGTHDWQGRSGDQHGVLVRWSGAAVHALDPVGGGRDGYGCRSDLDRVEPDRAGHCHVEPCHLVWRRADGKGYDLRSLTDRRNVMTDHGVRLDGRDHLAFALIVGLMEADLRLRSHHARGTSEPRESAGRCANLVLGHEGRQPRLGDHQANMHARTERTTGRCEDNERPFAVDGRLAQRDEKRLVIARHDLLGHDDHIQVFAAMHLERRGLNRSRKREHGEERGSAARGGCVGGGPDVIECVHAAPTVPFPVSLRRACPKNALIGRARPNFVTFEPVSAPFRYRWVNETPCGATICADRCNEADMLGTGVAVMSLVLKR